MNTPNIKDKYYITYGIFYLLGILTFIPNYFVIVASRYWIFKFRFNGPQQPPGPDPNESNIEPPEDRNVLQASFLSSYYIVSQLSLMVFIVLTAMYSKQLPPPEKRISAALFSTLVFYVINLIFCNIPTNYFQMAFFLLVMCISSLLSVCTAVIIVSLFEMVSNFPTEYYAAILTGQALCGVISAVILILTICVTTSPVTGGNILFGIGYGIATGAIQLAVVKWNGVFAIPEAISGFIRPPVIILKQFVAYPIWFSVEFIGTGLVLVTYRVYWYSKRNSQYFIYHVGNDPMKECSQDNRRFFSRIWSKAKSASKHTKLYMISLIIVSATTATVYPGLMSLVVADKSNGNSGILWAELYFVPVITFLVANLCDLGGRVLATKIRKPDKQYVILAVAIFRISFVPVMLFCNAQPRIKLPVVFDDAAYIIFTIVFLFSNGYLINLCVTEVSIRAQTEEEKYLVPVMTVLCVVLPTAASSFISLGLVHLL